MLQIKVNDSGLLVLFVVPRFDTEITSSLNVASLVQGLGVKFISLRVGDGFHDIKIIYVQTRLVTATLSQFTSRYFIRKL